MSERTAVKPPSDGDWISTAQAVGIASCGVVGTVAAILVFDERVVLEAGAVVLAMVYGVYFGFAVKSGTGRELAVEILFILVGMTIAVLSLQYGAAYLALGLLLHGIWDLLHHPAHRIVGTAGVPRWYVPFCAVYDFAAAAAVALVFIL
jgi:hypothetical protein